MRPQRDQLVLGMAFVGALGLHAVLLPWVGAAVQGESMTPPGDLSVVEVASPELARAGETIEVSAAVQYEPAEGMAGQLPRRVDRLVLSGDRKVDEGDAVLATRPHTAATAIARLSNLTLDAELPEDADGPYWLIFEADAAQAVHDRDRTNNTQATSIYIDGPQTPELAVTKLDAPGRATPGGSILLDYAVQNIGQGWAASGLPLSTLSTQAQWTDRVYLSANAELDEGDVELRAFNRTAPLAPEGDYRHERVELMIPRGLTGDMHLIMVADADQVLDQPSFTAGFHVHPITLVESGAPDLVVTSIKKPERLVISRPTPVTFSIANLGSVPTVGSDWADGLYLSRKPLLDDNALAITQVGAGQPLQPRSRYESTLPVTLPDSIEPGQWYLIVMADAGESVDEQVFEDNNALAVPVMVLTQKQADAEIQLGDPDRPERIVVQWIQHDRLEEHVARMSRTVQPAIQDQADPVPDAPLINDPKPPAIATKPDLAAGDPSSPDRPADPTHQQDAKPQPTTPDATQTDVAPRPQDPSSQANPRIDGLPGSDGTVNPQRDGIERPVPPTYPQPIDPNPDKQDTPTPNPGERRVESPADPNAPDTDRTTDSETQADRASDTDSNNPNDNDAQDPAERTDETESTEPTDNPDTKDPSPEDGQGDADEREADTSTTNNPSDDKTPKPDGQQGNPANPNEPQTPTRAPRDPSEAVPTNIKEVEVALQEGRVLVGKGIKVTTKLPIPPGTGSRTLAVPRNARVRVTFTRDGKVHDAKVIRSTTYADWDQAIESSLYRWSAKGEAVDKAEPYIVIEWNYLLNSLFEDEEQEKEQE